MYYNATTPDGYYVGGRRGLDTVNSQIVKRTILFPV